jgi:F-type H+-transporting ATPase subunit b
MRHPLSSLTRRCLTAVAVASLAWVVVATPARAESELAADEAGASEELTAEAAEHAAAAHGDHEAPGEINWIYGFLSERDGVEPSLLYRPTGMAPPLAALLVNVALLFSALYYFGRGPVAEGLKARRLALLKGIDEASAMKREAQARLAKYEDQLEHIEDEVARVEREMRVAGEAERERVLEEARRRREAMERDAHATVALEAKAAAEALRAAVVRDAIAVAKQLLAAQATSQDQRRFIDEYLATIQRADLGAQPGSGGAP